MIGFDGAAGRHGTGSSWDLDNEWGLRRVIDTWLCARLHVEMWCWVFWCWDLMLSGGRRVLWNYMLLFGISVDMMWRFWFEVWAFAIRVRKGWGFEFSKTAFSPLGLFLVSLWRQQGQTSMQVIGRGTNGLSRLYDGGTTAVFSPLRFALFRTSSKRTDWRPRLDGNSRERWVMMKEGVLGFLWVWSRTGRGGGLVAFVVACFLSQHHHVRDGRGKSIEVLDYWLESLVMNRTMHPRSSWEWFSFLQVSVSLMICRQCLFWMKSLPEMLTH